MRLVSEFMGLDVLVAKDEGLFAAEGLDLGIAALPPDEMRSAAEGGTYQARHEPGEPPGARRRADVPA